MSMSFQAEPSSLDALTNHADLGFFLDATNENHPLAAYLDEIEQVETANMPLLSLNNRVRRTPFTRRVEAHGVKSYSVYNHMLLPTVFNSMEADYHHLKRNVQVWDVSCERQVAVRGPDATKLVQKLTPRDLSKLKIGQCYYTPMVDAQGGMLNDPLTLKLADDHYWISIADSDLRLWIEGIANALGLDVRVDEPDVSPLAVQGPKSDDLMAQVFGDEIRDISFFRFRVLPFEGRELIVARSGYSKQGGFEIYVDSEEVAEPLWDALFARGRDLNVRAGCPNGIERIEGGLLSYGADITRADTPFECGLGKFCAQVDDIDCIGRDALRRAHAEGLHRQIRGLMIDGDPITACRERWMVSANGNAIGDVRSAVWSPDLGVNIAISMIEASHWETDTHVEVSTSDGQRMATVCALPFI